MNNTIPLVLSDDILLSVLANIALVGWDSVYTMFLKLTAKHRELFRRVQVILRPLILQIEVSYEKTRIKIPIALDDVEGTILISWGDNKFTKVLDDNNRKFAYGTGHLYQNPGMYNIRVFGSQNKYIDRLKCLDGPWWEMPGQATFLGFGPLEM